MNDAVAISDDELEGLFGGLRGYRLAVLAVSGGVDSTALMYLAARWRSRNVGGGPELRVATVDHRLRPESRDDADAVVAATRALDLPAHILTWNDGRTGHGLQARARDARYDLFAGLLLSLGEPSAVLVTAHTADDQAETLLMRLARGSGLDGVAAMATCRRLAVGLPFDLRRPLLKMPKRRLVATLRAMGVAWREDPSNTRLEFERVRFRAATATLCDLGLTAEMLSLSAERLQRARSALDDATLRFEQRVLNVHAGAYAAVAQPEFNSGADDLRIRMLCRVLSRFGGVSPPPRLAKVERLAERLAVDDKLTVTLGGCVVTAAAGCIRIFREPGRAGLPETVIEPGHPTLWDERFSVFCQGPEAPAVPLTVRALGSPAYAALRRDAGGAALPARAGATLPAIWHRDEMLAVPFLGIQAPGSGRRIGAIQAEFVGLPADERISE